jgi:hypothetical protein
MIMTSETHPPSNGNYIHRGDSLSSLSLSPSASETALSKAFALSTDKKKDE